MRLRQRTMEYACSDVNYSARSARVSLHGNWATVYHLRKFIYGREEERKPPTRMYRHTQMYLGFDSLVFGSETRLCFVSCVCMWCSFFFAFGCDGVRFRLFSFDLFSEIQRGVTRSFFFFGAVCLMLSAATRLLTSNNHFALTINLLSSQKTIPFSIHEYFIVINSELKVDFTFVECRRI